MSMSNSEIDKYANIYNRVYPSGNNIFRVRMTHKSRSFTLYFHDLDEAKEWLDEHYYKFFENPKKYFDMKKKKWV